MPVCDLAAELDALARRYAEEIGRPPDQIALEFGDAAVGINDFPHHLDHPPATCLIERAIDEAREVIEVDCFVLGFCGLSHQHIRLRLIKFKSLLDNGMQL